MGYAVPLVLTDLDDTLFQTERKMPEPVDESRYASLAKNGSHSYMTRAQDSMVKWLLDTAEVIPVTARSVETLSRCVLPFSSYKICSNGAIILDKNGVPDAEWMERTAQISAITSPLMNDMSAWMEAQNKTNTYRFWITEEMGMGVYFCVKSNASENMLDLVEFDLENPLEKNNIFYRHRNGNNLAYIPKEITKASAVDYLLSKLNAEGDRPVFGMGDSVTDLPFMKACQMMVIPSRSQINDKMLKDSH